MAVFLLLALVVFGIAWLNVSAMRRNGRLSSEARAAQRAEDRDFFHRWQF